MALDLKKCGVKKFVIATLVLGFLLTTMDSSVSASDPVPDRYCNQMTFVRSYCNMSGDPYANCFCYREDVYCPSPNMTKSQDDCASVWVGNDKIVRLSGDQVSTDWTNFYRACSFCSHGSSQGYPVEEDCEVKGGDTLCSYGCVLPVKNPNNCPLFSFPYGDKGTVYYYCYCEGGCPRGSIPNPLDPYCEHLDQDEPRDTASYFINRLIPVIPIVLGLLLVVMVAIGALKITTSGENEEEKKKGFKFITNALVGGGILILAIAVVSLFEAIFKVKILYGFGV